MHIPDGYLSPLTCAAGFALAVPAAAIASAQMRRRVKTRQVPTLAMLSAMCFLVMMFNIPIPDGTTAHAVGGSLVAVLLGPWAAMIAVTVALTFQALLFGDGGVLSFGVNVVNMAIVLPFVAYGTYRLLARGARLTSPRRWIAGAVGGYLGLTAAALCCAIELGVQPVFFHDAAGAPLYSPYHLSQTVPAMLLAHLVVAGFAEAAMTGGVIAYLQRANTPLLALNHPDMPAPGRGSTAPRGQRLRPGIAATIAMGVMLALTPLGLLADGTAFGEDAPEDLDLGRLGLTAVPTGMARYAQFWNHTVLADYGLPDGSHPVAGYLLSAMIGVIAVGLAVFTMIACVNTVAGRVGRPGPTTRPSEPVTAAVAGERR